VSVIVYDCRRHLCSATLLWALVLRSMACSIGGHNWSVPGVWFAAIFEVRPKRPVYLMLQVGFFLFVSAGVAAILLLARPVIDNTIQAFPYRTSGGGEQSGSADKSLIPGLDSGPSESAGDSIFD